jgi:hypothetical protein
MAAKAKAKVSTPPRPKVGDKPAVWYSEAVTLLADRCGSADYAEHLLIAGLRDGDVLWSYLREDGTRVEGDAAFWQDNYVLVINRAESRAFHSALIEGGDDPFPREIFAIWVERAAVLALLPGPKRKPGPGRERTYDHAAIQAAAARVDNRGSFDSRTVYLDQLREELRGKTKVPEDDRSLARITGKRWGPPSRA